MAVTHVALIRGINVGRAKRVAMADLRALVEELGYGDVRTLLNSGNAVFTAPRAAPGPAAARIEKGMAAKLGVPARVIVLTAADLADVAAKNPLLARATNPSRMFVAILAAPGDRTKLKLLEKQSWDPEALAVGSRAAYLWCPPGVTASALVPAVGRALADAVTIRNWATLTKLLAMTGAA
jgi:uncharacterized protein (DUF1697 family)